MIKIYHNPRCKKSRTGLAYLEDKTTDFQVVKYLDNPLSAKQWAALFAKTGNTPAQFLRKQETYFKENIKGKQFSDEQLIQIMAKNPKLIARPIIETDNKAILAEPPEKIDQIL